ncbi:MAG: hypothetical protein ACLQB1_21785, partial [Streptosporangiaceae bacterium]
GSPHAGRSPPGRTASERAACRALDIGSYQTAWAMLHWLRSVLVRLIRPGVCGSPRSAPPISSAPVR